MHTQPMFRSLIEAQQKFAEQVSQSCVNKNKLDEKVMVLILKETFDNTVFWLKLLMVFRKLIGLSNFSNENDYTK